MDRQSAKDYINQQQPIFLQAAAKRGYICPQCGQGTNKGAGMSRDKTGHYKCFDCGLYADVIELYGINYGIQSYNDRLRGAADYYRVELDGYQRSSPQEDFKEEYQKQPETEQPTHNSIHTDAQEQLDFSEVYSTAAAHITETDYPQRRGLSVETCKRYKIGYLAKWRHPKARKTAPLSPRLIIPISKTSYLARDTRSELTPEQEQYKKQLCKGSPATSWTFNREALQTATKPVFVVEGAIDALSIIEAGGEAVALSSTAYINGFVRELKEAAPAQPLIIALDNDKAGETAAGKLEIELAALHIPFYRFNPAGDYKDANERLIADRKGLAAAVTQGEQAAAQSAADREQERREAYLLTSAAAHLQAFIDGITDSVNTPRISTGFNTLDAALDGGLYEGLYICGAISSLGKTTFITQVTDQIAQQGLDVLIFSLEMARNELIAKSISRHTAQEVLAGGKWKMRDAKTVRGITDGARYSSYSRSEQELIQTAIKDYSSYAGHIFISEGIGDIGAQQIRDAVKEHVSLTGQTPVIVCDYLQILAPYSDRSTDKQNTDKAVLELKRLSRDFKTPVIAISSFNRMNYSNAVTMEAFKESGAIEYSADVLLGLQLAGAGSKSFDVKKEKAKDPREVELVILKNRNGKTGDTVAFKYYPMFNLFRENG